MTSEKPITCMKMSLHIVFMKSEQPVIMLREVTMPMFASSAEDVRFNIAKEPSGVSNGFWPPSFSLLEHQNGLSVLNSVILSGAFCQITHIRNIVHP